MLATPQAEDPTSGATHYLNPRLQDRLAAIATEERFPGYRGQTYARVRQRWIQRYGWEPYYRLGKELELWGPKRPPENS